MTPEVKKQIGDYLSSCTKRRFTWGEWDCSLLCADILKIRFGVDHGASFRGKYTDMEGAIKLLPCPLRELPEHIGLKPSHPQDGAVWWSPAAHPEGALGIFWQGNCLQPSRAGGARRMISNITNVKFFY